MKFKLVEGSTYTSKYYSTSTIRKGVYKAATDKLRAANIDTDSDEVISSAANIAAVLKQLLGLTGKWSIHHINYGTSNNIEHLYLVEESTHKDMHNKLIYSLLDTYNKRLNAPDILTFIDSIPPEEFKRRYIDLSIDYIKDLVKVGKAFSLKDIANKVRHD